MNILHNLAQILNSGDLDIPKPPLSEGNVSNALKIAFAIFGAIALLVVAIGAFQYVISQGEPQATGKAKNTILYALIGLVICASAFAIVSFVAGRIG